MKVAFFSSVLNHHQSPFCDQMYRALGNDFVFVSTMKLEEQRIKLKYKKFERAYELKAYTSKGNMDKAIQIFSNADIVIFSGKEVDLLASRMQNNKTTFLYRERLFKEKKTVWLYIKYYLFHFRHYWRFKRKPLYLLCAGDYSYKDHKSLGLFKNKSFFWGYFPPLKEYNDIDSLIEKKKPNSLLWVGRLIDIKQPNHPIIIAKKLLNKGFKFDLTIVGDGDKFKELKEDIEKSSLQSCVHLVGSVPQEEVRRYMERSEIFLFTSNRQEGWGAVLNEAMNSGCASISSNFIGSSSYLIKNEENGLIYNDCDIEELFSKVEFLLINQGVRKKIGKNAYSTIKNLWNSDVAAKRFLEVCSSLLKNEIPPSYSEGPMKRYAYK